MKHILLIVALLAITSPALSADQLKVTDNELDLKKQVLIERLDKLRAQYSVAETELRAVIAEQAKRAEAKKAEKKEEKK